MTEGAEPRTRRGSVHKRGSILDAARELFLAEGYDRASVDAISARAEVSKRTVYDYFGDKQAILASVVTRENAALLSLVKASVVEELADGLDLEVALLAFARRIATESLASSHYAALYRLESLAGATTAALVGVPDDDPVQLLAERFARYGATGHLRVGRPYRAAEHFSALTFLLALEAMRSGSHQGAESGLVDEILADGVDVFLRAYRPR